MTNAKSDTTRHPGYQPVRAFRALRKLIDNPDDTAQVFAIIESMSGRAPSRLLERFSGDRSGTRLLATKPNIIPTLANRKALAVLPEGSFGRAYLAFVEREGISADGLVDASVAGETGAWRRADDFEFVSDRMRDTHDLWHTVTGYHGDVLGEAALLAFSFAQTKNPGVALIVLGAIGRLRDPQATQFILRGFQRGAKAAWLPSVEWESMLGRPIAEVRQQLNITPVDDYAEMRSNWLRETGALQAA